MKLFTAAAERGTAQKEGCQPGRGSVAAALTAIPSIAMADIVVPLSTGTSSIAAPAGNERFLEGHVLPGNGVQDYRLSC
ncbi:MAG: hypothetical protein WBP81_20805 [Solirubrobacteraceae bacterium]